MKAARGDATAVNEELRNELSSAHMQFSSKTSSVIKLELQLREKDSVISALQKEMEERIKENCSQSTMLEERCCMLRKMTDSQAEVKGKMSSMEDRYKAEITQLKESIRSISAGKVKEAHSYESKIRQLNTDIDEMRVRSETFQRQLAAITSTYRHMFAATDASDNNSP